MAVVTPNVYKHAHPNIQTLKGSTYQSTRRLQSSEIPWVMCKIYSSQSNLRKMKLV